MNNFFRILLGLSFAIALVNSLPFAGPQSGLESRHEPSIFKANFASTPFPDGATDAKPTKSVKFDLLDAIYEKQKTISPTEEQGGKNAIIRFCEKLMGMGPEAPKSPRVILAKIAANIPTPEPKSEVEEPREIPNGPYKKPSFLSKLWHKITGKEEEPYLYLENYRFPTPAYHRVWEGAANEEREKKRNIFQRFWDWIKSFFPCLKSKKDYRIYGENGYWTNQKSMNNDDYIPYYLRHDYYKADRINFGLDCNEDDTYGDNEASTS